MCSKLRIYDNGGKTLDRYTILPPRTAGAKYRESGRLWMAIASSEQPFHPQGFGQCVSAMAGGHLGRRVSWETLPKPVQAFALQVFPEFIPN